VESALSSGRLGLILIVITFQGQLVLFDHVIGEFHLVPHHVFLALLAPVNPLGVVAVVKILPVVREFCVVFLPHMSHQIIVGRKTRFLAQPAPESAPAGRKVREVPELFGGDRFGSAFSVRYGLVSGLIPGRLPHL